MKWRTQTSRVVGLVSIAFLLSACGGAYQRTIRHHGGAYRPNSSVARVVVPSPAFVKQIDGRQVSGGGRRFTVIDFAPGTHSFEVIYREVIPSGSVTITRTAGPNGFKLDVKAGELYVVHSVVSGQQVAQFLTGPHPLEVTVPGSGRRIYLDRAPGSDANDLTDNYCFAVDHAGRRTTYPTFLVPNQVPYFSKDGNHVAFFVYHGRKDHQWIVDGVPQARHFERLVGPVKFSDDGSRHAYLGQNGRVVSLVVDGRPISLKGRTVSIGSLEFSPDARHYAYLARERQGLSFVIVDGEELGPFQDSFAPSYSSMKGQLVFFAKSGGKWRLYLNGKKSPLEFDLEPPALIAFDSKEDRFAYVARIGERFAVVSGGSVGPAYDDLSLPLFSPDDAHLVYIAKDEGARRQHVVVDGEIAGTFDEIDFDSLGFSEDCKTVFFKIRKGGSWVMSEIKIAPEEVAPQEPPPVEDSGGLYVEQPGADDGSVEPPAEGE